MIVIYNMLKLLSTKTSFWNARCNKNYVNIQIKLREKNE